LTGIDRALSHSTTARRHDCLRRVNLVSVEDM